MKKEPLGVFYFKKKHWKVHDSLNFNKLTNKYDLIFKYLERGKKIAIRCLVSSGVIDIIILVEQNIDFI